MNLLEKTSFFLRLNLCSYLFIILRLDSIWQTVVLAVCGRGTPKSFNELDMRFLELAKLKNISDNELSALPYLETWAMFLKHLTERVLEKVAMHGQAFKEAVDQLYVISNDPKNRALYDAREKMLMDMYSMQSESKEEGILEGKLEIARKLKKRGLSLSDIAEDTGLAISEIELL